MSENGKFFCLPTSFPNPAPQSALEDAVSFAVWSKDAEAEETTAEDKEDETRVSNRHAGGPESVFGLLKWFLGIRIQGRFQAEGKGKEAKKDVKDVRKVHYVFCSMLMLSHARPSPAATPERLAANTDRSFSSLQQELKAHLFSSPSGPESSLSAALQHLCYCCCCCCFSLSSLTRCPPFGTFRSII